jgi:hypothetical protein
MTPRPVELKLSRAQAQALVDAARLTLREHTSDDLTVALSCVEQTLVQYDADARSEAEMDARFEAQMAVQRAKAAAAAEKLPKGYKVMHESVGGYERLAAVRSRAEFARLAGITAGEAARYVTETGNGDDMEAAANAVGVLLVRDARVRDAKWKPVTK